VAQHGDGKTEPREREAEMLTDRLRGGVAPAIDRRRAEHAIVVLPPRHLRIASVDLGRRREHDTLAVLQGQLQDSKRAIDIDVEDLVRIADVVFDPDDCGEVVDQLGTRDQVVQDRLVEDAGANEVKSLVAQTVAYLRRRGCVEEEHFVATVEPRIGQVRAEEPCAAGDENPHRGVSRSSRGRTAASRAQSRASRSLSPSACTRSRRSAPRPVPTRTASDATSSAPGSRSRRYSSGLAHHTNRRRRAWIVNAPGYG